MVINSSIIVVSSNNNTDSISQEEYMILEQKNKRILNSMNSLMGRFKIP
jgi:hypothetical protein